MITEIETIEPVSTATPNRSLGIVLVVDDEESNRVLLRGPLEARGYEVEEAENGMQALQQIAQRAPDVILLDLMMPQMDGLEVCRRLRKDPTTAHLPILMITALSERGDRLLGIRAGANDFLNKPIDLQDVMLRVGNAIYAKSLFDQLEAEKKKSERLLLNILPAPVAERMKNGETSIADSHPDVTVMVADLVGFTTLAAHIDPELVVQLLNEIFSAFDGLTSKHGLEKIKTIGDAYMVAGGISSPGVDHPEKCAELAHAFMQEIQRHNKHYNSSIRLRIGISTGSVVAGVIGRKRFAYDLWSETVNLACQMEATAEPNRIQVSKSTCLRLKDRFKFELRKTNGPTGPCDLVSYWLGDRMAHAEPAVINEKVMA